MDDKTFVQRPFNGEYLRPAGGYAPLPEEADGEFRQEKRGPCFPDKHYYVLSTNILGELQVHVCLPCRGAFVYSETYGWVTIHKDSPLVARIEELGRMVNEANPWRAC